MKQPRDDRRNQTLTTSEVAVRELAPSDQTAFRRGACRFCTAPPWGKGQECSMVLAKVTLPWTTKCFELTPRPLVPKPSLKPHLRFSD